MKSGVTRAAANRKIRQDELREKLAAAGHLIQAVKNIEELERLETSEDVPRAKFLKDAIDSRLKIVNKYLPDLRSTEITGEEGGPVSIQTIIKVVGVEPDENADSDDD